MCSKKCLRQLLWQSSSSQNTDHTHRFNRHGLQEGAKQNRTTCDQGYPALFIPTKETVARLNLTANEEASMRDNFWMEGIPPLLLQSFLLPTTAYHCLPLQRVYPQPTARKQRPKLADMFPDTTPAESSKNPTNHRSLRGNIINLWIAPKQPKDPGLEVF